MPRPATQILSPIAVLALALATISIPTATEAQQIIQSGVSAADLARLCRVEKDLELDPCNSFILGAADGLSIGNDICPPAQGWSLIAPRVVRKYMRDHPEKLGTSGGILIYWALSAEFPCRRR